MLIATIAALTGAKQMTPKTFESKKHGRNIDPNGYCWIHGYQVKHGHNSQTCTRQKPGHQPAATRHNTMGGSQANKE